MPLPITYLKRLIYDSETGRPPAHFQLTALKSNTIISEVNANQGDGSFLITIPADNDLVFMQNMKDTCLFQNFSIDQQITKKVIC